MYKTNKEILIRIIPNRADKRKTTEKKKKVSKQKLLKGSHQAQNVTVLVLFTILF